MAILCCPIYVVLAKVFYGENFESLGETLRYLFQPDAASLFKGEFWQDWDASFKFYIFLALCIGIPAAIAEALVRHVL